jgi:hypothetical protein
MANVKISQLPAVTVPLAGTEELPVVQGGVTKRTAINNILNANTIPYIANGLGAVATPSYTFTGDLNTGMWSPAADTIAFSEGGVEAMRIDSAGNVGIGMTAPPQLLAVGNTTDQVGAGISAAVSTLYFGSPSTGSGGIRRLAYDRSTGNFDFIGNSVASPTTQMTITAAGNVGIGTTAPQGLLHVLAGASNSVLIRGPVNLGTGGSIYAVNSTNTVTTPLEFGASVYSFSGGNVGIGTTTPTTKLDVVGSASFGAAITTGTGLTTGDAQLELGANRTGSGLAYIDLHALSGGDFQARLIRYAGANGGLDLIQTGTGGIVITNEGSADTVFKTNATERMRITNTGKVGIGTSSPDATAILDVSSTTAGFLPPRMSTAQRDAIGGGAPQEGLILFNVTTDKLQVYSQGAWVNLH